MSSRGPVDPRLLRRLGHARLPLAAAVLAGAVAAAALAVQALVLAHLVAGALPGARHAGLPAAALAALLAATTVRALASYAGARSGDAAAATVKASLRAELVTATFAGGPGAAADAGELATLAGGGLDALDSYVSRCLPDLALAAIIPLLLLGLLAWVDWPSALVVAAALALFPVFGSLVGRASGERASARLAELAALGDHLVDLFTGLATVKTFGRSADERRRVVDAGERLRAATLATLRVAFLSALVLDTLASVTTALVAVPIGLRLVAGRMPLAAGLAALVLTPEVLAPLRRASAEFHESADGVAAARRALDLLDAAGSASGHATLPGPPLPRPQRARDRAGDRRPPGATREPATSTGAGRFALLLDEVSVARADGSTLLDRVDLAVEPGTTVAIVGANGAGKSTLLALLLGLRAPDSGAVLAGGLDPTGIAGDAVRGRCSWLPDRPQLLPATLAENLRVADAHASDAALADALDDAGAGSLLGALPDGLATPVGDGGWQLSAGERQRVALARALLRRASCFLLDEPTAHLDGATESLVVASLATRLAKSTAVVVTHRAAPLALASRVLELRGGRLVELDRGTLLLGTARR